MRKILWFLGFVIAGALLPSVDDGVAHAATFVVNSTADAVDANPGNGICASATGLCTLRAAIMEANALAGHDTISLPAGTYTLTVQGAGENASAAGDLDVTGDLTINGAGATITIIDAAGIDRVFEVHPGATVDIHAVTVRGGNPGVGVSGGGILNRGSLALSDSIVTANTGGNFGGGIHNLGQMTLTAVTVRTNATVGSNLSGGGGGIFNEGTLDVDAVTVNGNTTQGRGGGIYNLDQALALVNCTVSGNAALNGGGLFNRAGVVQSTNNTIAFNTASDNGGGLWSFGGTTTLSNTIVSGNTAATPADNCAGVITSSGHNLSSDASCAFPLGTDFNNTDPLLGPLANNDGPTETHALLLGSPASNAASCTVANDQRGVFRPQGSACDIGAYEALRPCITPPAGMVGWWPFDEGGGATSFQDVIGGNNATPFNSPVGGAQAPQPVFPGAVQGAVHFPKFGNALSSAVVSSQTSALANVGSGNFSIDAWVNVPPAAANRRHYIVNRFDGTQNRGFGLYVISPGIAGNERLEFQWGDGTTVSTVQTIAPLTTNRWHHVAVTFARNVGGFALDIRLYVDGVQQGQQSGNPPGLGSLVNFLFLSFGAQQSSVDEPITVDELEIFNVALSASDVQAIYNAGSAGKCKCTTGGQSVDLTVVQGPPETAAVPLRIDYTIQGCFGREMFAIAVVNAPPISLPPSYFDGTTGTWVPLPNPLSQIKPFVTGGPLTTDGTHTLFTGSLPFGTYDLFLVCDLFVNGHLDVTFPPLCLAGDLQTSNLNLSKSNINDARP
jgi:CSLREA domain-containing protein